LGECFVSKAQPRTCQIEFAQTNYRYLVLKIFNYFRGETDDCGPVHSVAKMLTEVEHSNKPFASTTAIITSVTPHFTLYIQ
jgi:hypothetical protein